MTSSSLHTVFPDLNLLSLPFTVKVNGALVIVSPFRITLL